MQAAIYVRVSTEEQTKGYSVPTQLEKCHEKALELCLSVAPEHVFVDDVSGSLLDRNGLNDLRKVVADGSLEAVIVYESDRLSRRLVDLLILEDEFRSRRVQLYFVKSQHDPTDEGFLFFQIRGAFAEFERRKIIERTQRGKRGRAQAGYPLGGIPPFGYRYESAGKHVGWYVADPVESVIVKQMFAWCIEGVSMVSITLRLSQMGIPTKLGRSQWSKSSVHRILTYSGYTGKAFYNKTKKDYPKKSGKLRPVRNTPSPRPNEEWIPLSIPVILDSETYEAAQRRLALNSALAKRNSKREYLLKGRVVCGYCGAAMAGNAVHGERYYRCCKRHSMLLNKCRCGLLRADKAEEVIWREVLSILDQPAIWMEEAQAAVAESGQKLELFQHEREILEGVLKECDRKQNLLLDLYLADGLAVRLFKDKSEEMRSKREVAATRKAELDSILEEACQEQVVVQHVEEAICTLKGNLRLLTTNGKQMALAALDIRVVWTGKVLEMSGAVPASALASTSC